MNKRLLSVILVLAMALSLVACGKKATVEDDLGMNDTTPAPTTDTTDVATADTNTDASTADAEPAVELTYDEMSTKLYNENLGEFYDVYLKAKEQTSLPMKFAMMAVAEGKLMGSAVMLPTSTRGGMYAINRIVPRTSPYTLWGNDNYRFAKRITTKELIKPADNKALRALWNELKGTGTYYEAAKQYVVDHGYTIKDSYTFGYSSDPATWDVLATSRAADSECIILTYDGLMEYDCEGALAPALAESYEVSADGLKYTFKLRQGAIWTDSQGRKVADVKADDFVAGMNHMMDAQGGLEYLIQGIIVNASEYITGEVTDFTQVGVKALDDLTVEYTLETPCSYFLTMLGYGVFAPMSRDYYVSMGGKFGAEYDPAADDYKYGKDSNSIAYCGPYLVTNATAENTIVYKASDSYWDAAHVQNKTITMLYNDGTDALKAYEDTKAGVIDGANLTAAALEKAKTEGVYDEYASITDTDATSFMAFMNLNRAAFANAADNSAVVSKQTEADIARTNAAMQNLHFRRALCMSVDRASYNAQTNGEDLKLNSLRNEYTPWNFVYIDEDVTVDINGTATSFKAGTPYGAIVQAQLDADGVPVKAYDPSFDGGVGGGDGYDGWYNPEGAKAEFAKAVEELAAQGITIDASNPVYIDLPTPMNNEIYVNQKTALKQSVENVLGGAVVVNLTEAVDIKEWYYAGYYTDYGYEANYDIYDVSGWGPDYGEPSTYLDTFLPDYAGYMIKCIGIF